MSEREDIEVEDDGYALYTVDEAAKLLRLGVSTVYQMVEQREIAFVRRGKSIRFRPEAIEDWIAAHETPRGRLPRKLARE